MDPAKSPVAHHDNVIPGACLFGDAANQIGQIRFDDRACAHRGQGRGNIPFHAA